MNGPSPPPLATWLDRRSPPHIVTLVMLASLAALNMNVFLPSLPSMARDLRADYALVQLAVSAYLGVTAVLQLVIGPLSDRFGRRPVLHACLLIFLAATVGCMAAPNIEVFLAFRMAQASVVSGMVLSRAIVRDMVGPQRAASMIGYVTMGMALVPMIGPMIGGMLDEAFGWRSTFAVILGFGAAVLALIHFDLGETNSHRATSFRAQFRGYPELVTSRRFWGYALTAASSSGAFFAFLGGGPYVASTVLGMAPSRVGFYFGFIATGYAFGNFLSGRYVARVGLNRMMLAGVTIATAGMGLSICLFGLGFAHPLSLFGPILLLGLGNGLTLPSANAGMLSVRPHLAGSASGLGGALMIGGGATLAAIAGAWLGPGTGPWPLLILMFGSSAFGLGSVAYVLAVARVMGPIDEPEGHAPGR